MQLKNSSKKKEIQNARYEFRRSISIDRHCFDDCVVSSGYFPQSNLTPEMTNFENFNFQVSLVDEHGLSLANQATSPRTNYARLEWKLVIIFKVSYAFDPKIDFPITLCPRFIAWARASIRKKERERDKDKEFGSEREREGKREESSKESNAREIGFQTAFHAPHVDTCAFH